MNCQYIPSALMTTVEVMHMFVCQPVHMRMVLHWMFFRNPLYNALRWNIIILFFLGTTIDLRLTALRPTQTPLQWNAVCPFQWRSLIGSFHCGYSLWSFWLLPCFCTLWFATWSPHTVSHLNKWSEFTLDFNGECSVSFAFLIDFIKKKIKE